MNGLLLHLTAHIHTHTHTHTHSVGLLQTSDQSVAETSTSQHATHKRQTTMPQAGFESAIPARERPKTQALDRAATGIGKKAIVA